MTALGVVVALATGSPAAGVAGFGDVDADDFFAPAVAWMVETQTTTGTEPGCFSPDASSSRAQAAAFLHRLSGAPEPLVVGSGVFGDVAVGSFFDVAVGWMAEEGITTGTTAVTFAPDRTITRGEIATMLWRVEGQPTADTRPLGLRCEATGDREPPVQNSALDLLDRLVVRAEQRDGYDRSLFTHWSDLDGDGCATRNEVLGAESIDTPVLSDGCVVVAGRWLSAYDGLIVTDPSQLDIDHVVPLAEAWDSGASDWSAQTRERFANDQEDRRALIAVTASTNRSKADGDPADWLPPDSSVHCTYASDWVVIKFRWQLSVDHAEHDTLRAVLTDCPNLTLSVEPATIEASEPVPVGGSCHPAYEPCLPNLAGDALNCSDLSPAQRPVIVNNVDVDPYNLDADGDGVGCSS